MYFYDIMMLYERFKQYIDEENEQQMTQQQEYEEKMSNDKFNSSDMMREAKNMTSNMSNFNANTLTKGFNF